MSEEGLINGKVYPFPHCDSNILHAPGKCSYCDTYPGRQRLRTSAGVNFTLEHDPTKKPCPSTAYRDDEGLSWAGNWPMDPEQREAEESYWRDFDAEFKRRTGRLEWAYPDGELEGSPPQPRDPLWVRAIVWGMDQAVRRWPRWLK